MTRYWIGVASRDHVKQAEAGGFCQFNHRREAPIRRLCDGDGILYYSPRETMKSGAPIRAFTAIGTILPGETYRARQSEGFRPWRRNVAYWHADDVAIGPLLGQLSFSANNANWGWQMRQGFFEIPDGDFRVIADAMGIDASS